MRISISRTFSSVAIAIAIAVGGMASPAGAQDEINSENMEGLLDEVIVTAQRKSENIQDVPISMTVFSEEQIANANMTNSADLATMTPSLTVDTRFGYENTSFSLRGFTQSLRTTASVATYFADVVAPRGQTSQTSGDGAGPGYLFDLQNVQVLRGPQGTLFGRNSTGGSILLVPNEPTDSFEGYLEGSVGNFDSKRLQTVVNIPISETFRARLGIDSFEKDGHLDNYTGIGADELGSSDYTTTRLSFLWDVAEGIENHTIFQYVDSESNGYTASLLACNPTGGQISAVVPDMRDLCQTQVERDGARSYYDVASTIHTPISTIKEERIINTTTWEINDDVTIKNIFGYAHLETNNGSAVFGINWPAPDRPGYYFQVGSSVIAPDITVSSQANYVDEIQIQGSAFDESLDWQVGLYYENSRPDGFSGNNSAAFVYCNMATIEGNPDDFDCFDPNDGFLGGVLVQHYKNEFLNRAIYGQATYEINDEFSVTAGLRYTRDEAEGYGVKDLYKFGPNGERRPAITTVTNPEVASEEPTGMLEASYKPTKDIMTYAKYSRGYRQGSVVLSADVGIDSFAPEYIDSYEIGAKSSFGGPIPGQFNTAVFYNELTDMQLQYGYISAASGPNVAISNEGKAVVQGVEFDLTLRLLEDLTATISYSHLDSELKEAGGLNPQIIQDAVFNALGGDPEDLGPAIIAGVGAAPQAQQGDEMPFAPKNTWVTSLNYLPPVPSDWGVISLGATYIYVGYQRAVSSMNGPYDVLPSYDLVNLNASWMSIYESDFDLSLYATNVLDEEYISYTSGSYPSLGIEVRQNGMPRMYGLRLRYNFGT